MVSWRRAFRKILHLAVFASRIAIDEHENGGDVRGQACKGCGLYID